MTDNRPIAIFDSGVGGLTVLKKIAHELPNEHYIYFGDTARVPYGEKTTKQLLDFNREILNWYKNIDIKAALMACNTSSAVALDVIKDEYDFPVFGLIKPTADYIASLNVSKIGIIATSATINSEAYKKAITKKSPHIEIFQTACPGLVEIVESSTINIPESYMLIKSYIEPLIEKGAEKIILGCTHYPYLTKVIEKITGDNSMLIDPAEFLVQNTLKFLETNNLLNKSSKSEMHFYVSSNPAKFIKTGQNFYSNCREAEIINFS